MARMREPLLNGELLPEQPQARSVAERFTAGGWLIPLALLVPLAGAAGLLVVQQAFRTHGLLGGGAAVVAAGAMVASLSAALFSAEPEQAMRRASWAGVFTGAVLAGVVALS